jgi:hypothetical protein
MPKPAQKYFENGAGAGKGFDGPGSQNAGTQSTSNTTNGAGNTVSSSNSDDSTASGSSETSDDAAAGLQIPSLSMAPAFVGLVTILSTLVGAGVILI